MIFEQIQQEWKEKELLLKIFFMLLLFKLVKILIEQYIKNSKSHHTLGVKYTNSTVLIKTYYQNQTNPFPFEFHLAF